MNMIDTENFTPEVHFIPSGYGYATFVLSIRKCPLCNSPMMKKWRMPETIYYKLDLKSQMERAGIKFISSSRVNNEHICDECSGKGLSSFTCYICNKTQSSTEIHESYGDPSDYVCKSCYNSIPASKWDKVIDELEKAHQYDFD